MINHDLRTSVSNFEQVLKSCAPLFESGDRLTQVLCQLFATKSANLILASVDGLDQMTREAFSCRSQTDEKFGTRAILPSHEGAHSAAQRLFGAIASRDRAEVEGALDDMGVFALCPPPDKKFGQLELLAAPLQGRSQMVLLIEMSILAAELADYARAYRYAKEAHGFNPGASELHDLYTVEGLVSFDENNIIKANDCLKNSIDVCMTDEYAFLACGTRAPNVMLAEKLFERGNQAKVVEYLIRCQDVWERHKELIGTWIHAIEVGERPDFLASGFLRAMNHPSVRIRYLLARAYLSEDETRTSLPKSRAEVIAARERLRGEYKSQMNDAIKGKLGTSNN